MLKLSSIPNEYYLGDLPGRLQYSKDPKEIIDCIGVDNNETRGFELCEHSLENLCRVTPFTQRKTEWEVILMMKSVRKEDEIWLKAALRNKKTGKIALLTTTNNKRNLINLGNRAIKTVDGTWFVGHYRMSAPIVFWNELKQRLISINN